MHRSFGIHYFRILLSVCILIILAAIIGAAVSLIKKDDTDKEPKDNPTPSVPTPSAPAEIAVPEYKDYGRGTVSFGDIVYTRPDADKIIGDFGTVCEKIEADEISYEEQLGEIRSLEDGYSSFITMQKYAFLLFSKNTQDSYWSGEYEYLSTSYSAFSQAVENLFVAAASSQHAESFERDYFGDGLIEEYGDGGEYTDRAVELMAEEARLEAQYSALSPSTVAVTFEGITDSAERIVAYFAANGSAERFIGVYDACNRLYKDSYRSACTDILVKLFKVRRLISDELGYDSYAAFAYKNMGHDYTTEDFIAFSNGITSYVIPVYSKLSSYGFGSSQSILSTAVSKTELINGVYASITEADAELGEIFSYMLQHSLYDIEAEDEARTSGALTTYLNGYNAPFIFMSMTETLEDYTTLCHEFGHFADFYINYANDASLDLSEVSSQALELLMLTKLGEALSDEEVAALTVYELKSALECLIFQSFYARFEHIAYSISYEAINASTLNLAVKYAARDAGLNYELINDVGYIMIDHIFLYPFYVQSYCISAATALEIYFTEISSEGAGFDTYKELITREDDTLTFGEYLDGAGLTDPFADGFLKLLADKIHYDLLGSHFFHEYNSTNGGILAA